MYSVRVVSAPSAPYGYYYYCYRGRRRVSTQPFASMYDAARYCAEQCLYGDDVIIGGGDL